MVDLAGVRRALVARLRRVHHRPAEGAAVEGQQHVRGDGGQQLAVVGLQQVHLPVTEIAELTDVVEEAVVQRSKNTKKDLNAKVHVYGIGGRKYIDYGAASTNF